jgi:hypothetical protein
VVVVVVVDMLTIYVIKSIRDMLDVTAVADQPHHTIHQLTEQAVVAEPALEDKVTTVHVVTLPLVTEPPAVADNLDLTVLAVVGVSLTQTVTVTDLHAADHMVVVVVVVVPAKAAVGAAEVLFESCGAQVEHTQVPAPVINKIGELLNVY